MRRARSDEAKAERRQEILNTARDMYEAEPSFPAFTMAALAGRAGLAKGTLYLYFRTKEELFLALLDRLFEDWFDDVDARLGGGGEWTPTQAADALAASVRGRETLARLLSILPTVVEHNVDFDAALRFKQRSLQRAAGTGALLERRLGWMKPGEGARFLVHLHALVIGVWQLAEPSAVIRRVMERPEMEPARVDFERDLRRILASLLMGMRAEAAGAAS
ncbi:MAG TPA: TetR family transcriptional regulator [Longimicrobium sp.]|jgi:AcrR family transcriptional regulator|uniref:TetR/AcrR family transcriptional regulator n=1 Tax=Longimicrobium sp. TaxID=2029185 RepID=UPI002ED81839